MLQIKASTVVLINSVLLAVPAWLLYRKYRKKAAKAPATIDHKYIPSELQDEILSRIQTFFGEEGLKKLKSSFVIVVGLGGVGSHCAHMLVRSGLGHIRLIDFDQVSLSSLNRHAVATWSDVGLSKAAAMKRRLLDIVPWCKIEDINSFFSMKDADHLLAGTPTFVLDCIDDVNTKAELIAYCLQHQLPVLTSMGAGGKADPTKLRIAPLSDCINDPLAQKIKWKLKKHNVSAEQVLSIFSVEKPVVDLLPLDEEQKTAPQDFGVIDYLRIRVMPVLGTSPAIFGQAMAAHTLCTIAGKPFEAEGVERMSKNLKHKLRQVFRNNELARFKTDEAIDLIDEDIEFIVQQVWKSRCAITHKRFGGHIILTLTRWYEDQPPTPDNLVLIMQNEAKTLAEQGRSAFPVEVVQRIEERLVWAKRVYENEFIRHDAGPLELYQNNSYKKQKKIDIMPGDISATTALSLFISGVLAGGMAMVFALQ